mgnify:CR=1 FL=1
MFCLKFWVHLIHIERMLLMLSSKGMLLAKKFMGLQTLLLAANLSACRMYWIDSISFGLVSDIMVDEFLLVFILTLNNVDKRQYNEDHYSKL